MQKREAMFFEEGDEFVGLKGVVVGAAYHCCPTRAINLDRWTQENIVEYYAEPKDDITVLSISGTQITVQTTSGETETWEFVTPTFDGAPQWSRPSYGCMALVAAR